MISYDARVYVHKDIETGLFLATDPQRLLVGRGVTPDSALEGYVRVLGSQASAVQERGGDVHAHVLGGIAGKSFESMALNDVVQQARRYIPNIELREAPARAPVEIVPGAQVVVHPYFDRSLS